MFEAEDLDCVFLETHLSTKKRYHMVYECIPLPREIGDMAPIYFKVFMMLILSLTPHFYECVGCCTSVLKLS